MSKIRKDTVLSVGEVGTILGYTGQSVRLMAQREQLPTFLQQFVKASKLKEDSECYTYLIPKYWVCMYAGLDPTLPIAEIVDLINKGTPPYINPIEMMSKLIMEIDEKKDV